MARRLWGIRVSRAWLSPALLGSGVVLVLSGGAVAAFETDTVSSFWQGLWWSLSLITTVGFIGPPPVTWVGATASAVLMVLGFLLLAMVGASLAALFVREEEGPAESRQESTDETILSSLRELHARLALIEARLDEAAPWRGPAGGVD
jgi:voltage-gated potassium channel